MPIDLDYSPLFGSSFGVLQGIATIPSLGCSVCNSFVAGPLTCDFVYIRVIARFGTTDAYIIVLVSGHALLIFLCASLLHHSTAPPPLLRLNGKVF